MKKLLSILTIMGATLVGGSMALNVIACNKDTKLQTRTIVQKGKTIIQQPAHLTSLSNKVLEAQQQKQGSKTAKAFAVLQKAIQKAERLIKKGLAVNQQIIIDAMEASLGLAMTTFDQSEEACFESLRNKIKDAHALWDSAIGQRRDSEPRDAFKTAIDNAQQLVTAENAREANEGLITLQNAIKTFNAGMNLKLISDVITDNLRDLRTIVKNDGESDKQAIVRTLQKMVRIGEVIDPTEFDFVGTEFGLTLTASAFSEKLFGSVDVTLTNTVYQDVNTQDHKIAEGSAPAGTTEIIHIGWDKYFQAHQMPTTVEKVPNSINPKITRLSGLFWKASAFNQDLSQWDTSQVTDMSALFMNAFLFNQDLANWDTSQVTNMNSMFLDARAFNQNLGKWDTSKVTNMGSMFKDTWVFNQDLANWDTAEVTDMSLMFLDARTFNQDISNWNVGKVTSMYGMFCNAHAFNQDLSNWDTSSVANMCGMFMDARTFNQDISSWDTSRVTNMGDMFHNAHAFNQDLSNWDTSRVTNMAGMFCNAQAFNQNLANWDTSKVVRMLFMFSQAAAFNQDISRWDVSSVLNHERFDEYTHDEWAINKKPTFISK
ncbi:BspA family leucine-rich repeat surface protein [Williamsoniiplasma lucivorax]|uniref:Lipoprotein n=1 Tax=Williamsoniiplasma lucivorax TaxID=209274 RepID=A0A2S5RDY5_9MOLU|nr:BspA family leucine-rich repeat surface protein [Williamsoniiplasma lucivorax]PPE05520.1 hypothetical protein ELUCI_v1c06130 [Williamsoniiplasma lucivorax]